MATANRLLGHTGTPTPVADESRTDRIRITLPLTAATFAAIGYLTFWASPAIAHVEVEAEPARAGAEGVLVLFKVQAENNTFPIVQAEVIAPPEIPQESFRPFRLPEGWQSEPTDRGFLVKGINLAPGMNLAFTSFVTKLPDAEAVEIKVLQTYADGSVSRWIGDRFGQTDPMNPAAVLALAPADANDAPDPQKDPSSATAYVIIGATLALTACAAVVWRLSGRRP